MTFLKHMQSIVALVVLGLSVPTTAKVIYEQTYNPNDYGAHFADAPRWTVYDNFTLNDNANVGGATLWGTYWRNGIVPNDVSFNISFHTDTSWSNPLYDFTVSAASLLDTGFNHNNVETADILEISLDFGRSLSLLSGVEYWLGVQAVNTPDNSFAWQNSVLADNRYFQNNYHIQGQKDVAFQLIEVPEPGTFALLMLGFAGLYFTRRKQKIA